MAQGCPICGGDTRRIRNEFCEAYVGLRFPDVTLQHRECRDCGHGVLTHDLPLDQLYNAAMAMPMDHGRDGRLDFIRAHLDLGQVGGAVVEIGGGPGELAEQTRRASGKARASVVDFYNRIAFPDLDFVQVDLNNGAARLAQVFDAKAANLFLLSHLIEHLEDPAILLGHLQKFENSFAYIEVPDFGSPHSPETLRWQMNALEHFHYFTDASLLALLRQTGFQVLAFETQQSPDMPVIRALVAPRRPAPASLANSNALFHLIAGRFQERVLAEPPGREIWIWGLSPYMAQALAQMGEARARISGIVDNRYGQTEFLGLPVLKEPEASPDGRPLLLCGSTYSIVQAAFAAKAAKVAPNAEFFTVPLNA